MILSYFGVKFKVKRIIFMEVTMKNQIVMLFSFALLLQLTSSSSPVQDDTLVIPESFNQNNVLQLYNGQDERFKFSKRPEKIFNGDELG